MCSTLATPIKLEGISKCYRIFQNPQDRFKQALMDRFRGILGKKNVSALYREHWALRDVSFELRTGEALGILGRNGAGKSTLLQIIAGTLQPTAGQVRTSGRIAALLELGSGFNPDFTGRENVLLNAQILGLSAEEAASRFDDIANFADIGDFIEQPVKTYSSGMMMRLAFAVQTVLEPDVLIVDEALSVGDAKFQEKCFRAMRRLREKGTTILFVSHDINAITSFCDRALLFDGGRLLASGTPIEISKAYLELLYGAPRGANADAGKAAADSNVTNGEVQVSVGERPDQSSRSRSHEERFGNGKVQILHVELLDESGKHTECIVSGTSCRIVQKILVQEDISGLASGFVLRNMKGLDVFGVTNTTSGVVIPSLTAGMTVDIYIDVDMWLGAGDYFLLAANAESDGTQCDCWMNALHFKVINTPHIFTTSIANLNPALGIEVC